MTVDGHERIAELKVRGPHPHDLFALLRDGFELTLGRFPGLRVRRLVPCPGHSGVACTHHFDYANLLNAVEQQPPVPEIQCPVAFKNISVSGLLFGIHWDTRDIVIGKIEEAQATLRGEIQQSAARVVSEISSEMQGNIRLIQREFLKLHYQEQRLVESRCPNVFTINPKNSARWRRIVGERVVLQLYCQAPGSWHPTLNGGSYEFTIEVDWLRRSLPYITGLIGVLKLVAPFANPVVGISDPNYLKEIESQIKLMEKLIECLPTDFQNMASRNEITSSSQSIKHLSGSSLRTLRSLLDKLDPNQSWGNLSPTLTPEGHLLWLCEDHVESYNV